MMNSSPEDNYSFPNNPNDGDSNRPISQDSLDRKISSVARSDELTIGPNDVLCGRSKSSFNHVGNRRFRSIVTSSLEEYNEASSKWAKSMVAAKLVGMITSEGGRFLKQKKGHENDWYELSTQEAKAKVSHAIRDAIAAKDKTKANRAGASVGMFAAVKKRQEPPGQFGGGKLEYKLHHAGAGSSTGSSSQLMAAASQQMPPQRMSLTSMAQPMFAMGGPQSPFMGGNTVQDQIQHLQSQALMPTNTPPFVGGGLGLGFGGAGPGMPLSQRFMQQQQQEQQRRLSSMAQQQEQMRRLSSMSQTLHSLQGRPHGNVPDITQSSVESHSGAPQRERTRGLRPSQQQGGLEPPGAVGVARAPPRQPEESKVGRNSSSDTEDGDTEFLSLIDTVLGPVGSPKGPRGKKGKKG